MVPLARSRLLLPRILAYRAVNSPPHQAPTTAPTPSSPYRRLAERASKTLAATNHPCDTSTMLNMLTHTLKTYSSQGSPNWNNHQNPSRQRPAIAMAQVTAAFREIL